MVRARKAKLPTPREPKVVTGLWLADARQDCLERAEGCPVMLSSDGKTVIEGFRGAIAARGHFVALANGYAKRLGKLVEKGR